MFKIWEHLQSKCKASHHHRIRQHQTICTTVPWHCLVRWLISTLYSDSSFFLSLSSSVPIRTLYPSGSSSPSLLVWRRRWWVTHHCECGTACEATRIACTCKIHATGAHAAAASRQTNAPKTHTIRLRPRGKIKNISSVVSQLNVYIVKVRLFVLKFQNNAKENFTQFSQPLVRCHGIAGNINFPSIDVVGLDLLLCILRVRLT